MIATHQDGRVVSVLLGAHAINPLSRLFQRELAALLDKLTSRRTELAAVLIRFQAESGDSRHELEHVMALTPSQASDCMQMLAAYNALLRRLECLGLPVIASLGGTVAGHALGLALACHRRIAVRDTRLCLPQVRMGLTPVAGEIARTVRLTGLAGAAALLLDGAVWSAPQALRAGLLHAVAAGETELARLLLSAQDTAAVQPWDVRAAQPPTAGRDTAWLQSAPAGLAQRANGAAPTASAAAAILCAMAEGAQVNFDTALLIESRYFCQVAINSSR